MEVFCFKNNMMNITKQILNLNGINQASPVKTRGYNSLEKQPVKDTFEKSKSNVSFGSNRAYAILKDIAPLDALKYKAMSAADKDILRTELGEYVGEVVTDCVNAAKALKKSYDDEFGAGNWEYVSIGRSCSNISEALKAMGVEAKSVPISGLTNVSDIKSLTSQAGFEDYKQYIYSLGLSPEKMKSSGKTYIFQDYCDSGRSLEVFEQLMRSDDMGLNLDNVKFDGINERLFSAYPHLQEWGIEGFNPIQFCVQRLGMQNYFGSLKSYTDLPKLDCKNLGDIKHLSIIPMSNNDLFRFGIFDKTQQL